MDVQTGRWIDRKSVGQQLSKCIGRDTHTRIALGSSRIVASIEFFPCFEFMYFSAGKRGLAPWSPGSCMNHQGPKDFCKGWTFARGSTWDAKVTHLVMGPWKGLLDSRTCGHKQQERATQLRATRSDGNLKRLGRLATNCHLLSAVDDDGITLEMQLEAEQCIACSIQLGSRWLFV